MDSPPPPDIRALQTLSRRVKQLLEMQQMERNRLDTARSAQVKSIQTMLRCVDEELHSIHHQIQRLIDQNPRLKQKADLLRSIPGIGDASMAHLLVLLNEHSEFTDAKQAVAFIGLDPRIRESGNWKGKTRLSKTGDKVFRKILYMPAMVAMRFNPLIRDFCNRLKAKHKHGKATVCAAMRKLLHIAFAALKSGKPSDPLYAASK